MKPFSISAAFALTISLSSVAFANTHTFNEKVVDISGCMQLQRAEPTLTDSVATIYAYESVDQIKSRVITCMEKSRRGYQYSQTPRWPSDEVVRTGRVVDLLTDFMAHYR
jgi:hypothetical protein